MGYRPDIDGLRAIAVLLVVLFHAGLSFPGGYVGVDVFFVISGFLITGIIRKGLDAGSFSMIEFWRRRISRIAPAATFTTIACVLFGFVLLTPRDLAEVASSACAQQVMLANFYFADRLDYFDGPAELKPLLHMWSLAVEEQFYLFFPIILILLHRFRSGLSFAFLVAIGGASLAYAIWLLPRNPADAFFLLPSRTWELLLGAGLHWLPQLRSNRRLVHESIAILGLLGIVVSSLIFSKSTPFPGLAAVPPCLGTAMVIHAGRTCKTGVFRLLSSPPLVFIGLISYSLYLIHWPIFAYLRNEYGLELRLGMRCIAVVASLILAAASWWCIERPLRRIGTEQPRRRVFVTFVLVTIVCTVGFGGVRYMEGFPSRLSAAAQRILETPPYDSSVMWDHPDFNREEFPRFGSCDNRVDLLLWGDSHASAIVGGIESVASELDICCAVAAHSGVLPVLNAWRPGDRASTDQWNSMVSEFLRSNRVPVVVLAGRWAMNVEGEPGSGLSKIIEDDSTLVRNPDDAERVLMRALQETIRSIRETGAMVVVLEQVPLQLVDSKRLLARELETGRKSSFTTTLGFHQDRQVRVRRVFDTIRDWEGVLVVDPFTSMFESGDPETRTTLGDAGGSYYSDDDHLSRYGAIELVAPALIDAVHHLFNRPIN